MGIQLKQFFKNGLDRLRARCAWGVRTLRGGEARRCQVLIDSLSACMAVSENLEASGIEVFRKSRAPVTIGEEPFTRVWRWKVNANTAGEYPYIT